MIEPCEPFDSVFQTVYGDRSVCFHAGQRVVMRGPPLACRLLADPVASMDYGRRWRINLEIHNDAILRGFQTKIMQPCALARPVLDPRDPRTVVEAGVPKCPSRELLKVVEFFSGNIRDREMGEFHIPLQELRSR